MVLEKVTTVSEPSMNSNPPIIYTTADLTVVGYRKKGGMQCKIVSSSATTSSKDKEVIRAL